MSVIQEPSIVIVGSSNMDLISYVPHLPAPGETLEGSSFKTGFGGKGANQAVMAALLGASVSFIGKVGDDSYGKQMRDNFINHSIDISHLHSATDAASGLAPIFVSSSGENSIVVIPGANYLITPSEIRAAEDVIKKAKVLIVQLEIPLEATIEALKIAKSANVLTIFNTAPAKEALPPEIYQYVHILCANQTELQILTGKTVTNKNEAISAAKYLLEIGAKNVLITLGSMGSVMVDPHSETFVPADTPKQPVIDTSGAGDCYLGSFAYFLSKGDNFRIAMEKASHIAAISVTRNGTQTSYPAKKELNSILFISHNKS